MIKVNGWQLTKITGHEDWYVIQVNFVQDFGDVIDVVFALSEPCRLIRRFFNVIEMCQCKTSLALVMSVSVKLSSKIRRSTDR